MISVVIPAYNEEDSIVKTIQEIEKALTGFEEYEIIVVDDGSTDNTNKNISLHPFDGDLTIVKHIENLGYGKSLYDGISQAKYPCIAIIDCDGSYPAESIKELYAYFGDYDMVVGARSGMVYKSSPIKSISRILFNFLAEYASGRKIADINSGLRIFRKDIILNFKDRLCTGFSFTTTITLLFFLNHYYVKYIPISYYKRAGKSKVNHFKDSLRAGQIIVQAILFYNPIKLFLLLGMMSLFAGLLLFIINVLLVKSIYLVILSCLCVASFLPIFCLGLVADILGQLYHNQE